MNAKQPPSNAPMRRRRPFLRTLGLSAVACVSLLTAAAPRPSQAAAGDEDEGPPTWRFRKADRPVKVVVLAGSVGAWQKDPYHRHLERMCANVEVKNLSQVGQGAYALKRRFISQVMKNWNLDRKDPSLEYWLLFHAPLNSVGMPEATNHHIRDLFERAHGHGFRVVGLTLSPWGDDKRDKSRWGGINGLSSFANTKLVVDFMLGRLDPATALGSNVKERDDPGAPWTAAERPDVAVDLYDTPLRDRDAAPRPVEPLRAALAKDRAWQRRHADLTPEAREAALDRDAQLASLLPQWYLREDLRAFDHIHPNEHGHRIIAELTCPALPESWGCTCPSPVGP